MKNKGFTLIELLAVIVILAIIALIATPIILGIINDARDESNKRSIELYASAIENAIIAYQLKEDKKPTTIDQVKDYIKYEGSEVVCSTKELKENGTIYLANCTVGDQAVDYEYGIKPQVYKPQYYIWTESRTMYIGLDKPSDAREKATDIDTKGFPFYLGFDVDSNNKVTEAYVCFVRNNIEYCLKGEDRGGNTALFDTNTEIIKDAFKDVVDTDACSFNSSESRCTTDGLGVFTNNDVDVWAYDGLGSSCDVELGEFGCYVRE